MIRVQKIIFISIFFFQLSIAHAQNFLIDNPYVINYSKIDYRGGIENWDIITTTDGYVYFANNEGLLKYDGTNWTRYNLPNKTIVRSIALDTSTQRIYVGGQDEVGYFFSNFKGELVYQSIKDKLPPSYSSIEDVWEIQMAEKNVLFRSVNKIFSFDGKVIKTLDMKSLSVNFMKYVDGVIYFGDPDRGLFKSENKITTFLQGSEIFKGNRIFEIIKISKNKLLYITEKKGIYVYDNKSFKPFLKSNNLNDAILSSGVMVNNNLLAIGSVLQGIIFTDTLGNYKFSLSKNQGLQTNSIITLAVDNNKNLWAGTTNGIDQILINSPYRIIYPDSELQGGVYAVKLFHDKLYVGTNNGLFYTEWPKENEAHATSVFRKVACSSGQVWALDVIKGELFMGHNNGAFQIIDGKALKISQDYIGTWRFIDLPDENKMMTGTYSGFQLYKKEGRLWKYEKVVDGFKESARIISKDKFNNIWVSHPYRGVYKIMLNDDYSAVKGIKNYGKADGLPSDMANYVTKLKEDIYVSGEIGIYIYNTTNDKFSFEKRLSELIGTGTNTRRLFQENNKAIWYVNENECGAILVDDSPLSKKIQKLSTPFLNGKLIGGFENIYSPDDNHVFVCTDKGLILINLEKLKVKQPLKIRFNEVLSSSDGQIIYGGHHKIHPAENVFQYDQNNITISFGTNQVDLTSPVFYSFKVEGLSNKWSEWSSINKKELSNLRPGKYAFKVKANSGFNNLSEELVFKFRIKDPWYSSKMAKIAYLFIFGFGLFVLIRMMDKRHEIEKSQLKNDREESEAKVKELINEKFQTEIDFKNKELALSTMHIVQKNETLAKLREELDHAVKQTKDSEARTNIKKVIGILSDDQRLEDDWESFALHFDQVHTDFLRRLKEKYPQLSPKDLKLCAYLRMNLTTKDIAPLLNISVRGVEISRYRLRKKMNIGAEINLNDFMMQF
jgi:ligand-binding sensor domain-containing protein/DNA-binding CsgD family transcriptional regulator